MSALSGNTRNERTIASTRPSARPVTTTAAAISMVTTTPFMIAGKYRSIRSGLKNASRKRDQPSIIASLTASTRELGDEGAGARLAGGGENLRGRAFLDDPAVIHEDHPVGGVA